MKSSLNDEIIYNNDSQRSEDYLYQEAITLLRLGIPRLAKCVEKLRFFNV